MVLWLANVLAHARTPVRHISDEDRLPLLKVWLTPKCPTAWLPGAV